MLGGLGFDIRPIDPEAIHVGIKFIDKSVGQFFRGGLLFLGAGDDFVVNIGKITDIGDLVIRGISDSGQSCRRPEPTGHGRYGNNHRK